MTSLQPMAYAKQYVREKADQYLHDFQISDAEIQEDVQRFAGGFIDRIAQAMNQEAAPLEVQLLMRKKYLLYISSAIDISTGPRAELNLLDMITFITLAKNAVNRYWIPHHYHLWGKEIPEVFSKSQDEILQIASTVMDQSQIQLLLNLITNWENKNPNQHNVESLRFLEFADNIERIDNKAEIKGLMSNLRSAMSTADEAILLGNRALFLSQRMPFLIRTHFRIAASDVMTDAFEQAKLSKDMLKEMRDLDPLINNISGLVNQTGQTIKDLEKLLKIYHEHYPLDKQSSLADKLRSVERIIDKLTPMTSQIARLDVQKVERIIEKSNGFIHKMILTTLFGFLFLIIVWWLGYYFTHR